MIVAGLYPKVAMIRPSYSKKRPGWVCQSEEAHSWEVNYPLCPLLLFFFSHWKTNGASATVTHQTSRRSFGRVLWQSQLCGNRVSKIVKKKRKKERNKGTFAALDQCTHHGGALRQLSYVAALTCVQKINGFGNGSFIYISHFITHQLRLQAIYDTVL